MKRKGILWLTVLDVSVCSPVALGALVGQSGPEQTHSPFIQRAGKTVRETVAGASIFSEGLLLMT